MKNIRRLVMATVALLSASSMALMQPALPVKEDMPFRITTGLKSGIFNKKDKGVGLNNLGLNVGFAHNVGYDFIYGLAISGDWASSGDGRLFVDKEDDKKKAGVLFNAELSAMFMPEVAEGLYFGALIGLGYSKQWSDYSKEGAKSLKIAFGDLNLSAGLGLSYCFTDMFAMSFAPAYTLTAIRFQKSDANEAEKKIFAEGANRNGIELPVGFYVAATDSLNVFLDVNTKFTDFSKGMDSWREDFTVGVNFSL